MADRIERIEVRIVSVPLPTPVAWSNVQVSEREYVLVWIHTADGGSGLGFTVGSRFRGGAAVIRAAIESALSPVILGRDPAEIERLWEDMAFETLLLGTRGAVARGLSAVDIALWDLLAKRAGLRLCDLLGRYRLRVPAYASGGYYYHDDRGRDLENPGGGGAAACRPRLQGRQDQDRPASDPGRPAPRRAGTRGGGAGGEGGSRRQPRLARCVERHP